MAKTRRASSRKAKMMRMMAPRPIGFMIGETIIIRRVNTGKGKRKSKRHTRRR